MVKDFKIKVFLFLFFLNWLGCSCPPLAPTQIPKQTPLDALTTETEPLKPQWSRRMDGAISSLSVSRSGQDISVVTLPEPDIEGSSNRPFLTRLEATGKVLWKVPLHSLIREQDLSEDGSLLVVSNYEDQIMGYNKQGKLLWSVPGTCKPKILNSLHRILCYHDDDSEPKTAFDLLDWSGQKIQSYPITDDILALTVSNDEKTVLLGLTKGKVILLGTDLRLIWEKKVAGEVIDLATSHFDPLEGEFKAVALYHSPELPHGVGVTVFDRQGTTLQTFSLGFRASDLEVDPTGKIGYFYGNGPSGQILSGFALNTAQEIWKKGVTYSTAYSYPILATPGWAALGIEEHHDLIRQIRLRAYNPKGNLEWNVILAADEEAYLYSHRVAAGPSWIIVGTDDAKLTLYEIIKPAKN